MKSQKALLIERVIWHANTCHDANDILGSDLAHSTCRPLTCAEESGCEAASVTAKIGYIDPGGDFCCKMKPSPVAIACPHSVAGVYEEGCGPMRQIALIRRVVVTGLGLGYAARNWS